MHPKKRKITIIGVILLSVAVFGAYSIFGNYSLASTKNKAIEALSSGNYAASMILYDELHSSLPDDIEIEAELNKAKDLLVAEENFLKAQKADEDGQVFDVRALLGDSEAINNKDFKYYKEAIILYERALAQISSIEEGAISQIESLRSEASQEARRNRALEVKNSQVTSELNQTIEQKNQTEQALESTQSLLQDSEKSKSDVQLLFEKEQKKTSALADQAAKEKEEKFINELNVYIGMLDAGNEYLSSARVEIENSKGISALLFISQAKTLFDEVLAKASEMRVLRTSSKNAPKVDKLLEAANAFKDAAKSYQNATIYIGDSDTSNFQNQINAGNALIDQAKSILNSIR